MIGFSGIVLLGNDGNFIYGLGFNFFSFDYFTEFIC